MKTTAQPARALSSRAVGLGAWLVPPIGSGRSECHENGPASITAWLPSECALTVGLLLALSGCSPQRRTVSLITSGLIFYHLRALLLGCVSSKRMMPSSEFRCI